MSKRRKIGRNDPCPCGGGKKYKKCHLAKEPPTIPPEVVAHAVAHFQGVEREQEALRAQGTYINVVKPVIFKGKKVWALGNRIYPGRPPNQTFHEFIIQTLQLTLGREWWEAQLKQPADQQHFIMKCFRKFSEWQKANATPENAANEGVWGALPDGWSKSLLSLAWDVCSLLHASHIPEPLLNRLKQRDGYQGARYELSIAAIFARLGFKIEFLDEKGTTDQKHCEFFASNESGLSIGVEAKSRHRPGVIHTPGDPQPGELLKKDRLGRLLNRALRQNPDDRPFFVFVDVNTQQVPGVIPEERPWLKDVRKILDRFPTPTPESPDPATALFFTNYSYHYQLENQADPGEYSMVVPQYAKFPIPDGWVFVGLKAALDHYGNVPLVDVQEDGV